MQTHPIIAVSNSARSLSAAHRNLQCVPSIPRFERLKRKAAFKNVHVCVTRCTSRLVQAGTQNSPRLAVKVGLGFARAVDEWRVDCVTDTAGVLAGCRAVGHPVRSPRPACIRRSCGLR